MIYQNIPCSKSQNATYQAKRRQQFLEATWQTGAQKLE
jgi:hypothetical protein